MVGSFLKTKSGLVLAIAAWLLPGMLISLPTVAQKMTSEDLQSQILEQVDQGNWAKVLELARMKIWMDVDKADGYYYSALAHAERGKPKQAKPFLIEAKKLDNGGLSQELASLENSMLPGRKHRNISEPTYIPIQNLDRFYYALTYNPEMPVGIHVGSLNNLGIGTYFLLRGNRAIVSKSAGFTVNSNGMVYGSPYAKTEATGQIKAGMAELMMGVTWRVFEPVWMYAGAGLHHSREYWEMEALRENSSQAYRVWARNQQINFNQPTIETGLMVDLKGINIRLGTSLTNFELEKLRYHFGLGFSVRKK